MAKQRRTSPQKPTASAPSGKPVPRLTSLRPEPRTATTVPSEAEIARRAYEIWRARGGQHGGDLDDWLQAERELEPGSR